MALQMWCSGMIGDGCEHLSIAWPGPYPAKQCSSHTLAIYCHQTSSDR